MTIKVDSVADPVVQPAIHGGVDRETHSHLRAIHVYCEMRFGRRHNRPLLALTALGSTEIKVIARCIGTIRYATADEYVVGPNRPLYRWPI